MARVEWSAAARLDLQELDKFLHEKNPDAAARAMLAIFEAADQIEAMPESGRPAEGRAPNERELVVTFGTGGYVVLYRVGADLAVILGIKHQREAGY